MRTKTARTATQSAPKTPRSAHCCVPGPVCCDDDDDDDKADEACDDRPEAQTASSPSAMWRERKKRKKRSKSLGQEKKRNTVQEGVRQRFIGHKKGHQCTGS